MANKRGKYNQRQNMADFYDLCSLKGGIDEVCCSTASSDNHPPSNLIQRKVFICVQTIVGLTSFAIN